MQIIKVINNNVISSEDDKGKEIVVMGKGIGFGKKAGEEIDETKIEKVFSLPDESTSQFMQVKRTCRMNISGQPSWLLHMPEKH